MNIKKVEKEEEKRIILDILNDPDCEEFLGGMVINDNYYLVIDNEIIGFFCYSEPTVNMLNLNATSLYYAVKKEYRGNGYASKILDIASNLLLNELDQVVVKIDNRNIGSMKAALKTGFQKAYQDDTDTILVRNKELENHKMK